MGIKEDGDAAVLTKLTVQLTENGGNASCYAFIQRISKRIPRNRLKMLAAVNSYIASISFLSLPNEEKLTIKGPSAGASMAAALYALARSARENKS